MTFTSRQKANALVELPTFFANSTIFDSIKDLYQFPYKQFRECHMFFTFVELVDCASDGFSIEVIHQNTMSQLLVPFSWRGKAGTATAGTPPEFNNRWLEDFYTYATLLPKCFPSTCNAVKDHLPVASSVLIKGPWPALCFSSCAKYM